MACRFRTTAGALLTLTSIRLPITGIQPTGHFPKTSESMNTVRSRPSLTEYSGRGNKSP
jgi:hypothetical protein